ncbi:HAMP domain-containing sensor histidine kinase [Rathayibacter sp. VKM Ac-2928]|uniref:sensor histidine kinase n=1 Tax=Rathayibacter sp. VKM Ac-2928 TaxID=2929479 RepID=UPI001FB3BF0B|nr:HAMP domain-containing sensor histidine kinase [Rathayibacter sp. VKM Ac-2928]MCJ1682816.1 HAMP domain-containing histidine kinase [Rathayibacter sp. VKM Ac-2928]
MARPPGISARVRLTLSYAGFLLLAGGLLLTVVWLFLLRYIPAEAVVAGDGTDGFRPGRDDLLRAFTPAAVAALAFLLLFGMVGGWFLAGRMLAPLRRITRATRLAAAGDLSHRIALEGRRDEFRELADGFDAMLEWIEAHDAEQRRFAANASHELRTPLAITRTLLEVARDDPDRDVDALVARLGSVNTRAIELVEALLLLGRADQRSFARESVDLSLLAEEAVETLLPLAERGGVALETAGGVARTSGSPALLQQLSVNLLHNAIVHNLPSGGWVRLGTSVDAGSAVLVLENSGAHLDPLSLPALTEPFQRGAARVRSEHAGTGLGLAIAASIVRAHGGELDLTARHEGGLRVAVRLPEA